MEWIKNNVKTAFSIVAIIFVGGTSWAMLLTQGKIDANTQEITMVDKKVDEHIAEKNSEPMTTHEITLQVIEHEKEIDRLETEDKRISDLQIQLITNQDNVVADIEEIRTSQAKAVTEDKKQSIMLGKIMGKLNIE